MGQIKKMIGGKQTLQYDTDISVIVDWPRTADQHVYTQLPRGHCWACLATVE